MQTFSKTQTMEHNKDDDAAWKWQMAHRITTPEQLEEYVELNDSERAALAGRCALPFSITPHYAALLKHKAIRRTVVPDVGESEMREGELEDPLGEEAHRAAPNLIHTYPDKVLLLVTSFCPVYCRYCTRARLTGQAFALGGGTPDRSAETPALHSMDASVHYIEQHTEIRDVLISGGDPLIMTDPVLDRLLERLRGVPHVRTVRIGSKVPAVLPMRITDALCTVLRRHRIWLSLHFTHPAELTPETRAACRRLSDNGIAMVSQTVLLKEINDDVQTLAELFYGLLEINVKPYYLLQCDPVTGSARFRTPLEKGVRLIRSLHGALSGLAVPQYVIDAPGGGGKIPVLSHDQLCRKGDYVELVNHEGRTYRYPDPL